MFQAESHIEADRLSHFISFHFISLLPDGKVKFKRPNQVFFLSSERVVQPDV